jgi:hypothetical protein
MQQKQQIRRLRRPHSCLLKAPRSSNIEKIRRNGTFFSSLLVLLSQKVAADGDGNHLFGRIHTSAMGGWNGSAEIKRW